MYQLRMLSPANLDFAAILEWLGNQSVAGASRWIDANDEVQILRLRGPGQDLLTPEELRS